MTVVTGVAFIDVSRHFLMRLIHLALVMCMAVNAREVVIVAADVTVGAGIPGLLMRTGVNREVEIVVIESGSLPGGRRVAQFAVGGEAGGLMVGISGVPIVSLVAEVAGSRRAGVLSVGMAESAGDRHVGASQRITGLRVMIEARRRPGSRVVADRADVAERRRCVDRVGRVVEISLMARVTIRRCAGVLPVGMTESAGERHVSSGQRIAGLRVMIEA